jgi:prepilin-type N-terminal cleavage/methylation domain-containing protein
MRMNGLCLIGKRAGDLSSKGKHPVPELTHSVKARRRAFTLIELLVVIAIIAILAALILPVLNASKLRAQGVYCMNNLHELAIGFKMYNNEANDFFPLNLRLADYNDDGGNWQQPHKNWVAGDENYSGAEDNTNGLLLVNGQTTTENWANCSQLALYQPNPVAYHCPADQSKSGPVGSASGIGDQGPPRVRSYSMNLAVGCSDLAGDPADDPNHILNNIDDSIQYIYFNKESELHGGMGPADLWVFIDENPDSIDDGNFAFTMPYHGTQEWWNCPSKLHMNATGIAYEDGHAEIHHWLRPDLIQTTLYQAHESSGVGLSLTAGGDPDITWMAPHTSILAPGQTTGP